MLIYIYIYMAVSDELSFVHSDRKKIPEGKPPGPPLGQAEKLAIWGLSSVTHRAPTKDGVDRKGNWEAG